MAKITNYFGWPHQSEYNDIWKAPLKQFKDVKTEDTNGMQVEVAYEEGIIEPDSSGNFNPNGKLTRQDAAVILSKAFKIPASSQDALGGFSDKASIDAAALDSVNALVAAGYMAGATPKTFKPKAPIRGAEAAVVMDKITGSMVSPVQALPRQNSAAPRRYVKLYCPTPGAVIHFTTDGSTPTAASETYSVASNGHINEMLSTAQLPERDVVYKAIAIKDGLAVSPVQTFTWHLYRPVTADFQHLLIQEKTATSPAIYRISNDSESVRAMAWYIEGQEKGLLFDALQTPANVLNLKAYIDKNIATKPNFLVIGHEHGDHDMQGPNFLNAGADVYMNNRGWSGVGTASGPFPAVFPSPADQAKIKNADEGDTFSLGGCDLTVFALPGHANGNIILQDKANGLIFSSDIYGCTRAGSADNVNISGVRVDLLLSLAQQVYSGYKKDGGKTTMLFTGHDETPLGDNNLKLFEAALQQVVDNGDAGCTPTLRGKNDAPNSRTTMIGDMWKDGTNWIALKLAGKMGDATEYLTSAPINYNGKDGYLKYSVLSNVGICGGDLMGTTVSWQPAPAPFAWAGGTESVTYSLQDKFDPWTYNYVIEVPKATESITISPTSMSTKIRGMTLDGTAIASRSVNTVKVAAGTIITIVVTAPDGTTTSTYKLMIAKI
ncbi:MAG: S-layer homology domain-containing protein [Spirochaetota bacterium]